MTKLTDTQTQLFNYLLGQDNQLADLVASSDADDLATRLFIYKNAYHARLYETIENDHEILGLFLGDDLFDQMVDGYIQQHPSKQTSLRFFADQLPDYLAHHKPFADHPIIAEIAQFERLLLDAFDARDLAVIDLSSLTELKPEAWPSLQFRFHPSMQIFNSQWNSVEIWQALKNQQEPDMAQTHQTSWLIWRNQHRLTQFRSMQALELTMLDGFIHGHPFHEICEYLSKHFAAEIISAEAYETLERWITEGLVIKISAK